MNINWVTKEQAKEVAAAGAVASITGFGSPTDVFSHDKRRSFAAARDGEDHRRRGVGQEAGYMPVVRALYDAGVTSHAPPTPAGVAALALTPDPPRILGLISSDRGPTRRIIDREGLGTIEVGKRGDVVLLGNPFDGYWNLTRSSSSRAVR